MVYCIVPVGCCVLKFTLILIIFGPREFRTVPIFAPKMLIITLKQFGGHITTITIRYCKIASVYVCEADVQS